MCIYLSGVHWPTFPVRAAPLIANLECCTLYRPPPCPLPPHSYTLNGPQSRTTSKSKTSTYNATTAKKLPTRNR